MIKVKNLPNLMLIFGNGKQLNVLKLEIIGPASCEKCQRTRLVSLEKFSSIALSVSSISERLSDVDSRFRIGLK
jgi:hypothetical protein